MAKSKVVSFNLGFTNSMRMPYATAILVCGHHGSVETVATIYTCAVCSVETTAPSKCVTGCKNAGFNYKHYPNPHVEDDRVTKLGDELECQTCDLYAASLAKLRALKPGDVHHSRFRHHDSRGFGPGSYYVYGYDSTSPTSVRLLMSIDGTKEAEELLSALKAAPLSPTERA